MPLCLALPALHSQLGWGLCYNMSFRTPISTLKAKGYAKEGAKSWLSLRISSLALIPLTLWFLCSLTCQFADGASYATTIQWLQKPHNAFFMILLVVMSYYHGFLGAKEIVEDYLQCSCIKHAAIIGKQLLYTFIAAATVFAVLSIYFKG